MFFGVAKGLCGDHLRKEVRESLARWNIMLFLGGE
jgi:hypothetical protein